MWSKDKNAFEINKIDDSIKVDKSQIYRQNKFKKKSSVDF